MDDEVLGMLKQMFGVAERPQADIDAEMEKSKLISEKFMAWVKATPELEGVACVFGCSHSADAIAALIGGQPHGSHVFDAIMMRLIYNIENERQGQYQHKHFTHEVVRDNHDDSLE